MTLTVPYAVPYGSESLKCMTAVNLRTMNVVFTVFADTN